MDRTNQTVSWVLGIIIVALVVLAAWWYLASDNSVGVPNTGDISAPTTGSMSY